MFTDFAGQRVKAVKIFSYKMISVRVITVKKILMGLYSLKHL